MLANRPGWKLAIATAFAKASPFIAAQYRAGVAQDVPPFVIAQGNHATPFGVNIEGLKRRGFSREAITAIRNAYKLLYRSGKTLEEAKPEIAELAAQHPEVQPFVDFFARSTRGLIR